MVVMIYKTILQSAATISFLNHMVCAITVGYGELGSSPAFGTINQV